MSTRHVIDGKAGLVVFGGGPTLPGDPRNERLAAATRTAWAALDDDDRRDLAALWAAEGRKRGTGPVALVYASWSPAPTSSVILIDVALNAPSDPAQLAEYVKGRVAAILRDVRAKGELGVGSMMATLLELGR